MLCLFVIMGCEQQAASNKELSSFVPQDAAWVLKVENWDAVQNEAKNNVLLSAFQKASMYKILNKKGNPLSYLTPQNESVISLTKRNDSMWDYTVATKQDSTVFLLDSIANKSVETLQYDGFSLQRITLNDAKFFTAIKDSVFLASTSQEKLQQLLKNETTVSASFQKAFNVLKNNELTSLLPKPTYSFSNNETHTLADYSALDVVLSPNGISASGVALVQDTLPRLLAVFKGQVAQQNDLENIIPANAKSAISITLSDASLFISNIQNYRGESSEIKNLDLLGSANEIGEIMLPQGKAIVLKSIDTDLTKEALAASLTELETYRDTQLFQFSDGEIFKKNFKPFIQTDSVSVAFQLENFFVFAQDKDVAQTVISAVKNNTVLAKSPMFENAESQISNASSFLTYGMNDGVIDLVTNVLESNTISLQPSKKIDGFSLAMLQFRFDRDFAHVHFVCEETSSAVDIAGGISEQFSKTMDQAIMGVPQFFSNHRTGTKNVIVQDIANTLHLLSNNGKTLWTKQLDDAILGEIHEVDILRNGRKQMAFTTKKKLYVVDRNGKDVRGFPINFKDEITQPLSVFDYDNNRKYRFVIVQGKEILLYDSQAKIVRGFTFKKTKSPITLPVEHIRMGNKDYILIAEENGKLNILSRTGKTRVPVKNTFQFSDIPITREGSNFVVIVDGNVKNTINSQGKVTTQPLQVANNYHFTVLGTTKATLDDNLLRINGKLVELPLGVYTAPKLVSANRKTYVTVTETQEKKVYLFQKNGDLVNGFPVFGASPAYVESTNGNMYLVAKSGDREVVVYKF
ncbi:LamG domain-containing protein [Marinirhabdus gelatinilytica]|uniref:Uncharacterized protein n=1 Tax=Marinirhabdus gelatinilytica TaxID=1703343 RepID=A0A370Q7F9_9FLAO|nr:hypothetical protein [Marinirhabdus gelatinilytica]RDK84315.1 hypothetical protein C8D94_105161 [Marinirhabdus gelatinilytica]